MKWKLRVVKRLLRNSHSTGNVGPRELGPNLLQYPLLNFSVLVFLSP